MRVTVARLDRIKFPHCLGVCMLFSWPACGLQILFVPVENSSRQPATPTFYEYLALRLRVVEANHLMICSKCCTRAGDKGPRAPPPGWGSAPVYKMDAVCL